MNDRLGTRALINHEDLQTACAVVGARFDEAEMEAERVELARQYLRAGLELEQSLRAHTRCAMVNHSGTLGANNLVDATERMFEALASYAARVRDLSSRFREAAWEFGDGLVPHGEAMARPATLDG
jgi:hypothetical protein